MTKMASRIALMATCAAGLLGSSAVASQADGIEAYRAPPRPSPSTTGFAEPAYSPYERSNSFLLRARAQLDAGNFAMARQILERRVYNSSNPETHYLSAVAHSGLGETDRARRLFTEALAIDADHIGARVGLALTDIRLERHDEAAASLAVIEARRAACNEACRDAVALDRAARVISHFLNAPQTL